MKIHIQSILVFASIVLLNSNSKAQVANCLTTDGTMLYSGKKDEILKISDNGTIIKQINIQDPEYYKIQVNKLAVCGSVIAAVSNSRNLYVSADNGVKWKEIFLVKKDSAVYVDAVATDGSNIYAGANSTVYMSDDMGTSWKKCADITNANIICIKIIGTTVYAGGNIEEKHQSETEPNKSALYVSTNKGASWKRMDSGLTETVSEIAMQDTALFAGTLSLGNNKAGLFRFNKKDSSWKPLKQGSIASMEVNGKTVFAVSDNEGVLSSTNGGESWLSKNNGLRKIKNIYNMSFLTVCQSTMYGISNGYVYLSTDNGEHWVQTKQTKIAKENPSFFSEFYGYCITGVRNHAFAGAEWGVYELIPNTNKKIIDIHDNAFFDGTNVMSTDMDGRYNIAAITYSPTGLYAQVKWGGSGDLFQSYDNGATWKIERFLVGTRSTTYGEIKEGGNYWYAAQNYILNVRYKKKDPNTVVKALLRNGDFIFAGSDAGIYRLTKGKDNITKYGDATEWTNSKVDLKSDSVTSIALGDACMYVGTKAGLFVSNNNGETYSAVNLNAPGSSIYSLEISGSTIFAGSKGGVFVSHDNGKAWDFVESGLPETFNITSLAVSGTTIMTLVKGTLFVSYTNGDDWEQAEVKTHFTVTNIGNKEYHEKLAKDIEERHEQERRNGGYTGYHSSGTEFHSDVKSTYNPNPTPSSVRMWGSQNAHNH